MPGPLPHRRNAVGSGFSGTLASGALEASCGDIPFVGAGRADPDPGAAGGDRRSVPADFVGPGSEWSMAVRHRTSSRLGRVRAAMASRQWNDHRHVDEGAGGVLQPGRALYARVVVNLGDGTQRRTDTVFAVAGTPVAPAQMVWGSAGSSSVDTSEPFSWTATDLAQAYRLEIVSEGSVILDTGPNDVSRYFAESLSAGSYTGGSRYRDRGKVEMDDVQCAVHGRRQRPVRDERGERGPLGYGLRPARGQPDGIRVRLEQSMAVNERSVARDHHDVRRLRSGTPYDPEGNERRRIFVGRAPAPESDNRLHRKRIRRSRNRLLLGFRRLGQGSSSIRPSTSQ